MLQDMEYTCVILRRSIYRIREKTLGVVTREEVYFHLCLFMSEKISDTSIVRARTFIQKTETKISISNYQFIMHSVIFYIFLFSDNMLSIAQREKRR